MFYLLHNTIPIKRIYNSRVYVYIKNVRQTTISLIDLRTFSAMNLDDLERRMANIRPEYNAMFSASGAGVAATASTATDCPLPAVERSVLQMMAASDNMCSNISHREQKSVNAFVLLFYASTITFIRIISQTLFIFNLLYNCD